MALIKKLKDKLGNTIYPKTSVTAVEYSDGTTVDVKITELNNNLVDVTSGDISTSHTLSEVSYCKKKCGIVNVTINLTTTSQVARYSAVAKIPDGFRPTGYVYLYCGDAKYAIQPNGNVQTLGTIASGTEIVMSATYICA